jgi:hypothetical protein
MRPTADEATAEAEAEAKAEALPFSVVDFCFFASFFGFCLDRVESGTQFRHR